ncbi:hypothetical protein [Nocardioides plantarum]|uniref:hypothetical protein n=1 Tax=Nocardioides plantarum TaxID=29299 RepID=UPI00360C1E56
MDDSGDYATRAACPCGGLEARRRGSSHLDRRAVVVRPNDDAAAAAGPRDLAAAAAACWGCWGSG